MNQQHISSQNAYKRDFINTYCLDEREESKNTKNEELIGEEKKETKNGYLIPQDIDIDFSESSIKVYCVKEVVEKVSEKEKGVKISLEDAKAISKRAKVGDMIKVEVTPKNFGRIAASNAKNIIIQKIITKSKLIYVTFFTQEYYIVKILLFFGKYCGILKETKF